MIQIYNPDNTDYEKNGDMTLLPETATVHVILNDAWEATLKHPIDLEGRWKYIVEDAVVKMPSFNGEQLFRIKKKEKSDSGISCDLEPIFYDAVGDCFLVDVRPIGKNGQEALNLMTAPNKKYTGRSNITKAATAYYQYKNLMEAINGDNENAFVNRWGGEILFDNYTVIINERVGGDHGVELRYGKNIKKNGLTEEVDTSGVVTRIYPKAYNGYTMSGNGYVDSPLIKDYPTIKTAVVAFDDVKVTEDAQEDDAENGVTICDTQKEMNAALKKRCEELFEEGWDKPAVTIEADMILLQNTELYEDYKILETVSLGDTVHCRHSRLGITTDARIIELKYDSVKKKAVSVVIGDFRYEYLNEVDSAVNRISNTIRSDGSVIAEKIAGFLNGAMTSLRAQYNVAEKQDVLAILFENLDEENPLYGAVALGTQGLMISKKRTADGRDWEWTTALTANGMVAGIIVAGILSDKLGKNYWNLDTGEFRLSGEAFNIDGKTIEELLKESENLLKSPLNLADTTYWKRSGTLTQGIADPEGGSNAVKLTATNNDCYISAAIGNNKPIKSTGQTYIFSVWLKASKATTIQVSLNHVQGTIETLSLTTDWKRYSITTTPTSITEANQVTIGGWGSFSTSNGADIFVYNPEVVYGQDVETKELTQEEIFNILTDNGKTQGIYLKSGRVYINATYIDTGILAGWTMDKTNKKITSPDGSIVLDAKNNVITTKTNTKGNKTTIRPGGVETGGVNAVYIEGDELDINPAGTDYIKVMSSFDTNNESGMRIGKLETNADYVRMHDLDTGSGSALYVASNYVYKSSSAKKYKTHVRDMLLEDAQGLYNIPLVWFKYKDGMLRDENPLKGKTIPGMYADDVAQFYPPGAVYNASGEIEDWTERAVIPAVVKLLQNHNNRLTKLEGGENE